MTAPGSKPQQRQARVDLPYDLAEEFRSTVRRRGGPTRATLLYGWGREAARLAAAGVEASPDGPLPPRRSERYAGTRHAVEKWTQTAEESAEWVSLIEGAGSSVRAVLAAAVRSYLA